MGSEENKHPSAPDSEQTPRPSGRKMCERIGLLAARAAVSVVPASLLVHLSVAPAARVVLGVAAGGILGFHVVNRRTRRRLKHLENERLIRILRSEFVIGWGIPGAVIVAAILLPPSWVVLAVIGALFAIFYGLYEPLQREIHAIVDKDEDLKQCTEDFENRKPLLHVLGIDKTIRELREEGGWRRNLVAFLVFWTEKPWKAGLSRTRTVLLYVALTCFCTAWFASGEILVHRALKSHSRQEHHGKRSNSGSGGETSTSSAAGAAAAGDTGAIESDSEECPLPPEYGAPRWARKELHALYFGGMDLNATAPPGSEIGGCTGVAIVPPAQHGTFVYTIGRNRQQEIRSVAVDSQELGPAIFLAPAAQRVLRLIHDGYAPLGGLPKRNVRGGDMTAATTEQGTFAFVRGERHLPGRSDIATPYVELPPTVATAWLGAMNEYRGWLWPSPPRSGRGVEEYLLSTTRAGKSVETIAYQPSTGTAQRDRYSYELPESRLDQEALEDFAKTAR